VRESLRTALPSAEQLSELVPSKDALREVVNEVIDEVVAKIGRFQSESQ